MSFHNDLPYNMDPWLSRAQGALEYPTYPHEPLSTLSPVQEGLHISDPELLSFPLQNGAEHMNPTFPETPRLSRSHFDSPSTEGAYPYTPTQPLAHSPDFTRMHQSRDVAYGTIARLQPKPTSYSPCYSPNTPIEPALPTRDNYPIHRRTSSASSASSPTYIDRSFQQSGWKCEWRGCRYTGAFGRKFELKRHVETQHIFRNAFECPDPRCRKGYNRKDNLEEHLRRAHDM
ncbi:hypothetical protein N7507_010194 [Penicillium longicatenatum]|nr:hypothetical protein N7507_010194 [Penicillium longicatenatum]